MTRDELIAGTRQLIAEGDRLRANPSLASLQMWLQRSDDLLATAWGSMDRYHLAWLMVGKPKVIVRGRPMTADEEAAYVREVAEQKTAALRMSLDAVERQGMPFVGETGGAGFTPGDPGGVGFTPGDPGGVGFTPGDPGGVGFGPGDAGGVGFTPGDAGGVGFTPGDAGGSGRDPGEPGQPNRGRGSPERTLARAPGRARLPVDPALAERLAEARRQADAHLDHDAPRAPRPERMER